MAGETTSAGKRNGFTLLELLVVIFIVAVMVALLYPVFSQVRERGRQMTCLSQVSQHAKAVLMYAQDYDDKLPVALNGSKNDGTWDETLYPKWWDVIEPYLKNHDVFRCPDDAGYLGMKPGDPLNDKSFFSANGSSYSSFIGWLPPSETTLDSHLPRDLGGLGGVTLAMVSDPTRAALSFDAWPYWHALMRALNDDADDVQVNVSFLDGSARRRSMRSLTTYLVKGPDATDGDQRVALGDVPDNSGHLSGNGGTGQALHPTGTGGRGGSGTGGDTNSQAGNSGSSQGDASHTITYHGDETGAGETDANSGDGDPSGDSDSDSNGDQSSPNLE